MRLTTMCRRAMCCGSLPGAAGSKLHATEMSSDRSAEFQMEDGPGRPLQDPGSSKPLPVVRNRRQRSNRETLVAGLPGPFEVLKEGAFPRDRSPVLLNART